MLRPDSPTRWGKESRSEIDYVAFNHQFLQLLLPHSGTCRVQALPITRLELGSDHCCVFAEVALTDPRTTVLHSRHRRKRRNLNRCRRWFVDLAKVATSAHRIRSDIERSDLTGQWEILKLAAQECSIPTVSLKYKDSAVLKEVCQARRLATCPHERANLTRSIISLRHVERLQWMRDLHERSRHGDHAAIKYLRQRQLPAKGSAHEFVQTCGSVLEAGNTLKEHFAVLFGAKEGSLPAEEERKLQDVLQQFRQRAEASSCEDFTEAEIQLGMDRLKKGKVTGPSGMSNEFLLSLWGDVEGRHILSVHLNKLLHCKEHELPEGFCSARVALLPKLATLVAPRDYRPINLLESLHKLFAWLLVSRLQPHWTKPELQLGGIRGTQVCDALAAAHARVTKESKEQRYGIYLSCDVQAAFDSVCQSSVAEFLLRESSPLLGQESMQLLQLVMSPHLQFSWQDQQWELLQGRGVQQGGSHSAVLFAFLLGIAVQRMEQTWRDAGETSLHHTFSLVFVDDLLFTFTDWAQAVRLTHSLQEHLAVLGLRLNPSKTCVMSHESQLQRGREHQFPPQCFLSSLTWSTQCTYLKKVLTHYEVRSQAVDVGFPDSTALLLHAAGKATHAAFEGLKQALRRGHWCAPKQTIQICNIYLGATFFWYTPIMEPLQKYVDKVKSVQVTFLVMMMGLYIPNELGPRAAQCLNRLRRRTVLVLLNWFPSRTWVNIWVRRRWGYLGHLLRFPDQHVTKQAVLGLTHTKQAQPGPWHRLHRWGLQVGNCSQQSLQEWAHDRASWENFSHSVEKSYTHWHAIAHETCAPTWRDVLRLHVSWMQSIVLVPLDEGCEDLQGWHVLWIDREHGVQNFSRTGSLYHVLRLWAQYFQLEFQGIMIEINLEAWLYESSYHEFLQFHNSSFKDFQFLVTFSMVSRDWLQNLLSLA